MSSPDDNNELVQANLYTQSYEQFGQLGEQLPKEELRLLAQEVLARVAAKLGQVDASDASIHALSQALIGDDPHAAARLIEGHYQDGADVQSLYLRFMAPAAHLLGVWWKSDDITFADVTVGTGRIYAIMRGLTRRFPAPRLPEGKHALFAPVPHDNHTLGVKMATDLCRKAGWKIDLILDADHDAIIEKIEQTNPLIIGLSGGGQHALAPLARLILAIRVSAPRAYLLVSGNIVNESADSLKLMDIDAMDAGFEGAINSLDRMWSALEAQAT